RPPTLAAGDKREVEGITFATLLTIDALHDVRSARCSNGRRGIRAVIRHNYDAETVRRPVELFQARDDFCYDRLFVVRGHDHIDAQLTGCRRESRQSSREYRQDQEVQAGEDGGYADDP